MKIGELNFPKIELEIHDFMTSYKYKLWSQYAKIIESTEGRDILDILSNDPRVQKLEGKMILDGSGSRLFDIRFLGIWFLWYANKFGVDAANKALDLFLNSQEIKVLRCLWILGVTTEEEVNLCEDIKLLPINQMINSDDKERFLQANFNIYNNQPSPQAALVYPWNLPKISSGNPEDWNLNQKKYFLKAGEKLQDIALLMNLLTGVSCLPWYSTSYIDDSVPFGPFSSSGGGIGIYDVLGTSSTVVPEDSNQQFQDMYNAFSSLVEKEKIRWRRILSRLSQSKRREQIEDKVLDLGISLEMMLLDDNKDKNQLALTFRLRGTWLISNNEVERLENYKVFSDIYDYRSQVAHTGLLEKGDFSKIATLKESFGRYQEVAEKIGRRLLIGGKPDWNKLLLGSL